jgi:hypothetical protein
MSLPRALVSLAGEVPRAWANSAWFACEDGKSLAKLGYDGTERVKFRAESVIAGFQFTVTIR